MEGFPAHSAGGVLRLDDFQFLPIFYDSMKIKYCLIDKRAPMTKPQKLTGNG